MNKKKILSGFMAVSMIVSAFIVLPTTVDATETTTYAGVYEDIIIHEDRTDEFNKKWSAEEGKAQAPTKTGYVFGGWYKENGTDDEGEKIYVALTESDATKIKTDEITSGVFAKFVPAYVLSVKAQIDEVAEKGAERTDEELGSIRLISSVDSKDYQKVGFDVLLANKTKLYTGENNDQELETTKIYTGLKVRNETYEPTQIFGKQSTHLSVWRLDEIYAVNDAKIINVTPYWITKDGTKVYGLTKYVHVEDGYKEYISIPVNLCDTSAVAAGMLTVTYPQGLSLVKDKVEFEGIFPESDMAYNDDGNGTIQFAGNVSTVGTLRDADGIYVNLRFKVDDDSEYSGVGKGDFLVFKVEDEQFCDWDEEPLTIDAWNIQY